MGWVAKEVSFICRHGLNDLATYLRIGLRAKKRAQVVDRGKVEQLDDGRESTFKEIMFVIVKDYSYFRVDVGLKEAIVVRQYSRDDCLSLHQIPYLLSAMRRISGTT